ncbi:MAG: hypothetical protein LAO23_10915 [Acidobacteriia bacterium]|nr:hypothetical protein [Terriglobia bacterium]
MRRRFAAIAIVMCIFILGVVSAAENKFAVPDTYQVKFSENVRLADTLLPKGTYEVRHVMDGSNHIMVFRQLGTKKPVEVRAKCTLVPLGAKATESQTIYILNAANQRVLQELVFKGEDAKHVF